MSESASYADLPELPCPSPRSLRRATGSCRRPLRVAHRPKNEPALWSGRRSALTAKRSRSRSSPASTRRSACTRSFSIAIIISFSGGRPGMISAATGAMALVIVPLVEEYGVGYLFAATVLAGTLQVGFGYLGVGELMRFIPRTVTTGFVNALAILIFLAQVPDILLNGDDAELEPVLAESALHRRRTGDHLRTSPAHLGRAIAARGHRAARRRSDRLRPATADRRRHGRPPNVAPRARAARRAVQPRHAAGDPSLLGHLGAGRSARVVADRAAPRRSHRHWLRQEPRVARPGHRQCGDRLPRRDGGVRHDRSVDDQPSHRWSHEALDARIRRVPHHPDSCPRRLRGPDPRWARSSPSW